MRNEKKRIKEFTIWSVIFYWICLPDYVQAGSLRSINNVYDDCGKGNFDLQNEINHVFQEEFKAITVQAAI